MNEYRADPAQEEEWIGQTNLVYGGLIGVGLVIVQPFLTATSLDLSARVSVIAFAVAIPLLAALVMVNRQEAFRRRATTSMTVSVAKPIALTCAFAGLVAGFWHILWIAGVAMLAGGLAGVAVHSAGFTRLERDGRPVTGSAESGDSGV